MADIVYIQRLGAKGCSNQSLKANLLEQIELATAAKASPGISRHVEESEFVPMLMHTCELLSSSKHKLNQFSLSRLETTKCNR